MLNWIFKTNSILPYLICHSQRSKCPDILASADKIEVVAPHNVS